jgi:tRNA/rRNA methyltransferase
MAGTNRRQMLSKSSARGIETDTPAIILIEPQLGENIGMVARAMLNCGLTDLRLVRPRDGWPNLQAENSASGADVVLENVKLFTSTSASIADLNLIYATTARDRDMTKEVITPEIAAREIREIGSKQCGILFGREAKGMKNEDIVLANKIVIAPLNPGFTSLNLSQAVLLLAYEWYKLADDTPETELRMKGTRLANNEEMVLLFEHLESELDNHGFLRVKEKRPVMVQNIRNVFQRANMTEQEVRTFRGVVKSLSRYPRREN